MYVCMYVCMYACMYCSRRRNQLQGASAELRGSVQQDQSVDGHLRHRRARAHFHQERGAQLLALQLRH